MLCDQKWYEKHKDDYTEEEIAALGIEITVDKRKFPKIRQGDRKGKAAELLKLNKGRGNDGR
ncbi:hypothetical protein LCGC14_0976570 [marine sediment metagenome]|uniref:Uncharacterized protein n=1 Tax=marine sediment metagenome TaxID=412755 RepID=A0A0F9NWA8_9ZZZZ